MQSSRFKDLATFLLVVIVTAGVVFAIITIGSSDDNSNSSEPKKSQTTTQVSQINRPVKQQSVWVHPATREWEIISANGKLIPSKPHGVVAHRSFVRTIPRGYWITRYDCAKGLRTLHVYVDTVPYKGAIIRFIPFERHVRFDLNAWNLQSSLTLQFLGRTREFASKVVSLITDNVSGGNGRYSHPPEDDVVVNLKPSMITPAGIKLATIGFTSGSIIGVKFCIRR